MLTAESPTGREGFITIGQRIYSKRDKTMVSRRVATVSAAVASAIVLASCAATKYQPTIGEATTRSGVKKVAVVGWTWGAIITLGLQGIVDLQCTAFIEELQKSGKFEAVAGPVDVSSNPAYTGATVTHGRGAHVGFGFKSASGLTKNMQPEDQLDWAALCRGLGVDGVILFNSDFGGHSRGYFGSVAMKLKNVNLQVVNSQGTVVYQAKGRQLVKSRSLWSWVLGTVSPGGQANMMEKSGRIFAQKMIAEW